MDSGSLCISDYCSSDQESSEEIGKYQIWKKPRWILLTAYPCVAFEIDFNQEKQIILRFMEIQCFGKKTNLLTKLLQISQSQRWWKEYSKLYERHQEPTDIGPGKDIQACKNR